MLAHRMTPAVPAVEVSDNADAAGVRCPYGKADTVDAIDCGGVRANPVEGAQVRAFAQQVDVEVAERAAERIWVGHFPRMRAATLAQTIAARQLPLDAAEEEAVGVDLLQVYDDIAAGGIDDLDAVGIRREGADADRPVGLRMRTEHAEAIAMSTADDGVDIACGGTTGFRRLHFDTRSHCPPPIWSTRSIIPRVGMDSHAGRLPIS
jgi:hypothetical protein